MVTAVPTNRHAFKATAPRGGTHSIYVEPADPGLVAGRTHYAVRFTSALAAGNVFAVQFHPEKSQRPGLQLLRNFSDWRP